MVSTAEIDHRRKKEILVVGSKEHDFKKYTKEEKFIKIIIMIPQRVAWRS